ncbi:uncharacterized protein LOC126885105 [Diabrotica virgifera virgifera]|uniref:Zinc finger BED domain-containing protein 4-like n=1 Tax=Diabrotica virgifera virgifera TaxID=50390 RepID=A0ABM5KBC1_DIAVI|nr:uncharacterized protein LOC126885105 [Diabrotica virgifera virgifera]
MEMEPMVSRMVCKDGFALSIFCTSKDLRFLFSNTGFELPHSPNTIRSIVKNFATSVQSNMMIEFESLKKQKHKFALTFDEWTSQKNHRYLNLNVHLKETHFNLGLIRIHGSCTAEHTISLVKDRLKIFGLDLDTDIIGMTTDGASVMVKAGKLLSCYHQLCFAHGIQLAVIKVLYEKKLEIETESTTASSITLPEDGESTDDDDDDILNEEEGAADMTVILNLNYPGNRVQINPRYNDLLQKVRNVVKLFKKSPTKYDTYLQKYVKEEIGKELCLVLDCRTRWNSLLAMVERFYKLKQYIEKSLIDIKSSIKFTDHEWSSIKGLIDSLQPCKLAVEALSRRESTVLTADTTLKFILEQLNKQGTTFSGELADTLREKIKQRRTFMTGILIYLQNPAKYNEYSKQSDDTFFMPKKTFMRHKMTEILKRLTTNDEENVKTSEEEDGSSDSDSELVKTNLTLKEELENIRNILERLQIRQANKLQNSPRF